MCRWQYLAKAMLSQAPGVGLPHGCDITSHRDEAAFLCTKDTTSCFCNHVALDPKPNGNAIYIVVCGRFSTFMFLTPSRNTFFVVLATPRWSATVLSISTAIFTHDDTLVYVSSLHPPSYPRLSWGTDSIMARPEPSKTLASKPEAGLSFFVELEALRDSPGKIAPYFTFALQHKIKPPLSPHQTAVLYNKPFWCGVSNLSRVPRFPPQEVWCLLKRCGEV